MDLDGFWLKKIRKIVATMLPSQRYKNPQVTRCHALDMGMKNTKDCGIPEWMSTIFCLQ
jgi:hypothetical protein